jgi:hypothetical protein
MDPAKWLAGVEIPHTVEHPDTDFFLLIRTFKNQWELPKYSMTALEKGQLLRTVSMQARTAFTNRYIVL